MARAADAIADNAEGDFFVDASCIDCDLCRQLAPEVFARSERAGQSYVAAQPSVPHRARMALVTCPTASIGTRTRHDFGAAAAAFPEHIGDGVYFCGYASEASYGASSYLIVRDGGNVLVDSPRFARLLADRIAALGGVRWMVLTHQDDVADHAKFRARFACERVIHRADARGDTRGCERIVGDDDTLLADDLRTIHVPGHTRGSIALLHRDTLFSGDHLWASDDLAHLEAGPEVCWYSWPEQLRSIAKLAAYDFVRVLPGHGRRFTAPSPAAMKAELQRMLRAP